MKRHLVLLLLLLGLPVACTGPEQAGDTGSAPASTVDATIYGIRTGTVDTSSTLNLDGVVVTTAFDASGQGFYVQDAGSAEHGGLYVFLTVPVDGLAPAPGQLVDLRGRVEDYGGRLELVVTDADDVETSGEGTPTITGLDPADAASGELDAWQGQLVSLAEPRATACPEATGEVPLEGDALWLGDSFTPVFLGPEDALDQVVGVLDWSLERHVLLPRSGDDLLGEATGEGCGTTVVALKAAGTTGGIVLDEVVSTSGLSREGTGFFVQDPGGGEDAGLWVNTTWMPEADELGVQAGGSLRLRGIAREVEGVVELVVSEPSGVDLIGEASVRVSELAEPPDDWTPWLGQVVSLVDLTVTTDVTAGGTADTDWDIKVDDLLWTHDLEAGHRYSAVTGALSWQGGAPMLCPRDADDVGDELPNGGEPGTVVEIRTGRFSADDVVELGEIVVTAPLALDGTGFTIQDPEGGEDAGLWVRLDLGEASLEVFPGDVALLMGTVEQDDDGVFGLVLSSDAHFTQYGGAEPAPSVFTDAPEDWTPHLYGLVQLQGGVSILDDAGTTSWGPVLDESFTELSTSEGASYGMIQGIVLPGDPVRLAPRTAFDLFE